MHTFTPVSPLPKAQSQAIIISPALASAGNGDSAIPPELRFDAQGQLWAAYSGCFAELYSDEGSYCGPRPVTEVVHVHSRELVIVVTDEDVFVMSAAEYHAQV